MSIHCINILVDIRENKDESSFNSRNINLPGCCNLSLVKKIAESALKFNIDGKIRGLRF
jgi:hypothetical protein